MKKLTRTLITDLATDIINGRRKIGIKTWAEYQTWAKAWAEYQTWAKDQRTADHRDSVIFLYDLKYAVETWEDMPHELVGWFAGMFTARRRVHTLMKADIEHSTLKVSRDAYQAIDAAPAPDAVDVFIAMYDQWEHIRVTVPTSR